MPVTVNSVHKRRNAIRSDRASPTGRVRQTWILRAGRLPAAGWTAVWLLAAAFQMPLAADTAGGYIPRDDNEVVAELSPDVVALAAQARASTAMNDSAFPVTAAGSIDRTLLLQRLMAAYELALQEGSPRAYGHALALVETWPASGPQPVLIRVIKADILQHNHAFEEALVELAAVLEIDPNNPMALQMRPQVSLVAGHFDQVPGQCRQLMQAGYAVLALNCQAQLQGLTGHAGGALERVEAALQAQRLSRELTFELHITAAEIARRLNRPQIATGHFESALTLSPASRFAAINYAGLMLEQGRADAVVSLLQARQDLTDSLELQLLYVVALIESGQSEKAQPHLATLESKVNSLQQRGPDQPHKLIASYALQVSQDFPQAHDAALSNWEVQKEPSDTLLFAQASAASGQNESLDRLARWRDQTGLQDYRLDAVLREAGLL